MQPVLILRQGLRQSTWPAALRRPRPRPRPLQTTRHHHLSQRPILPRLQSPLTHSSYRLSRQSQHRLIRSSSSSSRSSSSKRLNHRNTQSNRAATVAKAARSTQSPIFLARGASVSTLSMTCTTTAPSAATATGTFVSTVTGPARAVCTGLGSATWPGANGRKRQPGGALRMQQP